jgi:hypothetical protein
VPTHRIAALLPLFAALGLPGCSAGIDGSSKNRSPDLAITELMSENTRGMVDDFHAHSDWIEVTNRSTRAVNLLDYGISDDENQPYKWTFPYLILPPGERIVVFASNRDKRNPQEQLHTNFRISATGEAVMLTSPTQRLIDRAPPAVLPPNISWGRVEEASSGSQWRFFPEPTPGEPNIHEGWRKLDAFKADSFNLSEISVRPTDGFLDQDGQASDWIEVHNGGDEPMSLHGYGLTDDLSEPFRWRFPDIVLAADEFLIVFASAKDRKSGELHTNFRLRAGELVGLFTPDGIPVDLVDTEGGDVHGSIGRSGEEWVQFGVPTPGRANDAAPVRADRGELPERAVTIHEVMSESKGNPLDTDWVELRNGTSSPVNLAGYGLSDDPNRPHRWRFPSHTIEPGGLVVVRLTGRSCVPPECVRLEANFRLRAQGETLLLSRPSGEIEDRFLTGRHAAGISSGRTVDGRRAFFSKPTPGKPNTSKPLHGYAEVPVLIVEDLEDGRKQIRIPRISADAKVYYTLGGDPPTRRARRYRSPITLKDNVVFRARAYKPGHIPSEIATRTVLKAPKHEWPILAITVDPYRMFHKVRGLHEMGPGAAAEYPHRGANFWSSRELVGHVEFMTPQGGLVLSTGAGVRMFGGFSRGMPKKSFKLSARSEYGAPVFEVPVFGEHTGAWLDEIVVRSGGQDAMDASIRDVLATKLAEDMNVDIRRFSPTVLYINSRYWGLYQLRDPIDPETLGKRHGVDPETVRIASGEGLVKSGYFGGIRRYISKHDATDPGAMSWVENRVDMSSFIDWLLLQIYLDNHDGGNCRYWNSDASSTRWRWIFYDLDLAMNDPATNTVRRMLSPRSKAVPRDIVLLFTWLSRDPGFQQRFLERASFVYQEVLSPSRANATIDYFAELYEPEISQERKRWKHVRTWEKSLGSLRRFFNRRPAYIRKHFKARFDLTDEETERLFPVWEQAD